MAARIDLVSVEAFEEFYALVDVALAPRRGVSPRMAAQAVGCGVPTLALAGPHAVEPYSRFLRDLGLDPALVASDAAEYVAMALALAHAEGERRRVAAMTVEAARRAERGAAAIARGLEEQTLQALGGRAAP
jgi:predicted O-linked N-acetylglucosamine transferase (SPINDLY family)